MKPYLKFSQELNETEEVKNTSSVYGHYRHFEDIVFYYIPEKIISYLKAVYNISSGSTSVSIKYDGSPSIFFGKDPSDEAFFVSTKSIFSTRTPKLIKSKQDLSLHYPDGGDLPNKLWIAYQVLSRSSMGSESILQGDLLFGRSLKEYDISSEKYIGFQPNVLIYAFPKESSEASDLISNLVGITVYASWSGSDFLNMKPTYAEQYVSAPKLWVVNPYIKNIEISDPQKFKRSIEDFISLVQKRSSIITKLVKSELSGVVEKYHNSCIRKGYLLQDPIKYFNKFAMFMQTEGKDISLLNKKEWMLLFDLHMKLTEFKDNLIEDIQSAIPSEGLEVFAQKKNGIINETGHEGFVCTTQDLLPFKLINRLEFSKYNFDDENITRGWTKK